MLLLSFFFKPGRSRSVARYEDAHQRPVVSRALPYLAPAPLAAAVTPYGGWRVEPFFPIQYGDAVRRALSTSKESDNPHAESPRPHRRSLIQLLKNRESFRGGWVLSSNTLTSGVHSTPCVFFNQPSFPSPPPFFPPLFCYLSDVLIHYPTAHPPVPEDVWCAQPSQALSVNSPFLRTHSERGGWGLADAEGVVGGRAVGGRLITHSCVEGVRWAPEVLDKVQGLVYTRTCSKGCICRTWRWTFTQWRQAV